VDGIISLSVEHMRKHFLRGSVSIAAVIALSSAVFVTAQAANQKNIFGLAAVKKYFTNTGTYTGASIDPITKIGTLTVAREEEKRGTVTTNYVVNAKTKYLLRHGTPTALNDFKIGEELSIYGLRNPDGSITALTVTDNNVWFLDPAIQEAKLTAVDTEKNTVTVKEAATNVSTVVPYTTETLIQNAKAKPGTESDLVVGKDVRIRGIMRKTGSTTVIERASVIWVLPEHGE
jgi:hypothetical protein